MNEDKYNEMRTHIVDHTLGKMIGTMCRLGLPRGGRVINLKCLNDFIRQYGKDWYNSNQVPSEGTQTQDITKEL